MHSKLFISVARWIGALVTLAGIIAFFHVVLQVNQTTVALSLLLFILYLASRWGLRYAIVISFAAGCCYNYFFLPPVGHFTISDPQNIVALFVFLITSIFASNMSDRIGQESRDARSSQTELQVLYRLSRALLQTDELVQLTRTIPGTVAVATGAQAVLLFLLEENRIYRHGSDWTPHLSEDALRELSHAPGIISSASAQEAMIPLRTGVRPRGVLIIHGLELSHQSLDALGGLIAIAIERSNALDQISRTEAARESERLRDLMLDSMTHELAAPLSFIGQSLDRLVTEKLEPSTSLQILTAVREESNRLSRLVAQAVEMAKFDTQEVRMVFVRQSLENLIRLAIEHSDKELSGSPVNITLAPRLPDVSADSVWVDRLITKLLQNAAKYSPEGAPIFITAERTGLYVACSIADRGRGIEPFEQSLIFDKFVRSRKPDERSSGTGLGLAICRTIVEAHGGKIEVNSQPGRGSVFTFTLRAASN